MTLHHGDVFRANAEPRHMWVALFDGGRDDDRLLLVSLTTMREGCMDDACVLEPADFPRFIRHKTTVAYSRAVKGTRPLLIKAVADGLFCPLDRLPSSTLKKVVAGAHASAELSASAKALLPRE